MAWLQFTPTMHARWYPTISYHCIITCWLFPASCTMGSRCIGCATRVHEREPASAVASILPSWPVSINEGALGRRRAHVHCTVDCQWLWCHIIRTHCEESHENESPAWTLSLTVIQNCRFSFNFDQSSSEQTCQIRRKEVFYVHFFSLHEPKNCYLLTNMAC